MMRVVCLLFGDWCVLSVVLCVHVFCSLVFAVCLKLIGFRRVLSVVR